MNIVIHIFAMQPFVITFHPIGRKIQFSKRTTILKAAESIGLNLAGPCGSQGKCGKCKIRVLEFPRKMYIPPDPVSKRLLSDSELKKGMRLACTTFVNEDTGIELPTWAFEETDKFGEAASIMVDGWVDPRIDKQFTLNPVIKGVQSSLPKPTLDDNISDLERLAREFGNTLKLDQNKIELNIDMIRNLTKQLHDNDWQVEAILAELPNKHELLDLRQYRNDRKSSLYGVALDLGTSTIVAYLLDLYSGQEQGVASSVNPQLRIGADVISRIRYTMQNKDGDRQLSNMLQNSVNDIIHRLCSIKNIKPEEIFEIVAVGNTTILHSFLGFPITQLGTSPYTLLFDGNQYFNASELNIKIHPNAKVYIAPLAAGFLGSDAVGIALITNMVAENGGENEKAGALLAIDIGTNGEILLGNKERLLACSAAAGPAFEGSNLRFGIRAGPGAIHEIVINGKRIEHSTIGDRPAIGLAGSGVVDGINEFLQIGAIEPDGNINKSIAKKWLRYQRKTKLKHSIEPSPSCDLILPELCIVPRRLSALDTPITITQGDIREIQLAKAAIRTGVEILMGELGVSVEEIDRVYLAGAFGNYLKPKNALGIGLLPKIKLKKVKLIGNSAGTSAKVLLCSKDARLFANKIAQMIDYVDLAMHNKFQDLFIENMKF